MLDDQVAFDKVTTHLLTQKAKSKNFRMLMNGDEQSFCAYRGQGGLKCAIGCLIPDELYKPEMEGKTPRRGLLNGYPELQDYLPYADLAEELQEVHDSRSIENWPLYLRKVAYNFGLDASIVDKFAPE